MDKWLFIIISKDIGKMTIGDEIIKIYKFMKNKINLLWDNTYVTRIYKKRKVSDIM